MNARASLRTAGPAILVGVLAFALTVQWREQRASSRAIEGHRQELALIVAQRQGRTAELEKRLADLRAQYVEAASRAGGARLRALQSLADRLEEASGATAVSGPGIVVGLTDAQATGEDTGQADTRIQDVDIQSVVNALWIAGAEAIAVNGQRLVATTAIRNAGRAVLVNYRVLTSPYRIAAIGNASQLTNRFSRSQIARRFRGWVDIYGLGFDVSTVERMELPAFQAGVRFRYARERGQ